MTYLKLDKLTGLLGGLAAGQHQSRGLMDVLSLHPAGPAGLAGRDRYAPPLEAVKLVEVPSYGTMVLRNTSAEALLVLPMHIGFFQAGAQNHATSRALVLDGGETLKAEDCYCIQESQGGYLKEAQQRFLMLPLGLRPAASARRAAGDFGSLWQDIDGFNRFFGIAKGGHYERFLRPHFKRLQSFRHAFELQSLQVGAAYFVGGFLTGVELAPSVEYFAQLYPVLNIYCYGPAELAARRRRWEPHRHTPELAGVADLEDLRRRLKKSRRQERRGLLERLRHLVELPFEVKVEENHLGLRVQTLEHGSWTGQQVHDGQQTVYLSLFRDAVAEASTEDVAA